MFSFFIKLKSQKCVLFLFLSLFVVNCQHSAQKNEKESTPLFYYSATKGTMKAYLLGSMHVAEPRDLNFSPPVMKAFGEAKALLLEIPILSENAVFLKSFSKWVSATPRAYVAKQFYVPEVWKELVEISSALSLPTEAFSQMHAHLIVQAIVLAKAQKMGFKGPGVDGFFEELAIKQSKKVLGLETFDDQLGILFSKPSPLTVADVKKFHATFEYTFSKLVNAWRQGNDKEIEKLVVKGDTDPFSKTLEHLAFDPARNKKMAARIVEENLRLSPLFVVLGAAHLIGKGSVVEELSSRGYVVKRLHPSHARDLSP